MARMQLTDAGILRRLRNGSLVVDVDRAVVRSHGRELTHVYDSRERYLFVEIWDRGARKKIALHRLVWMAANDAVVPGGHQVHHTKARWRNGIKHLELRSNAQHHYETYGVWPASEEEATAEFMAS